MTYGVFSVARRFDPELDAFLITDAARPVQAQAGFTVLPNLVAEIARVMEYRELYELYRGDVEVGAAS